VLSNLQALYQPQSPSAGFMGAAPHPLGGFAAPQPMAMKPPIGAIPGMMAPAAMPINLANDPFATLHSFASAPSVMVSRTSSNSNGNAAPSLMGNAPLARSASAPSNDPFAGLI
jgi:hypothetical protein